MQQKLHINLLTGESEYVDLTPEEIAQREIDRAASLARDKEQAALEAQQAAHEDTKAALMRALAADLEALEGAGTLTAQQQREILARVVRVVLAGGTGNGLQASL